MDQQTLDALAQQQSWLPTQAAVGLADTGGGTQGALTTAEAMRQAVVPQDDGYHSSFDDPVLHKKPSLGLAVTQYLSQAIGPWPVAQPDLVKLQQGIAKAGFGKDLNADGTWNPGWQAAFAQWHSDHANKQYAKGGSGGLSFGSVMHAMTSLDLEQAGNALVGFVKSIPGDFRHMLADIAAGTVTTGAEIGGVASGQFAPGWHTDPSALRAGQEAAAGVENIANQGTAVTPEEYARRAGQPVIGPDNRQISGENLQRGVGNAIGDIGTVLLLSSAMGKAGKFASAIGVENAAAGDAAAQTALTTASAYQGPGVVARSLGGSAVIDEATGETVLRGGLKDSRVFNNIPVLSRSGPWLEKLADADGLYYRMRGAASAAIYNYPIARLGGQLASDISIEGAKVRATAAASQLGGGDTNLSTNVQGEHAISAADHAVQRRLGFTILGTHIAPSINDIQWVLHPAHGAASAGLANDVNGGVDMVHGAMQDVGFTGALQRATGKSLKQLEDEMGGAANFDQFYSNKIAKMAATHAAELERQSTMVNADVMTGKMDVNKVIDEQRAIEHRILNDPAELTDAIKSLRSSFGNEEVVARLQREMAYSRIHGFESLGGANYMDASKVLRNEIHPYLDGIAPATADAKATPVLLNGRGDGMNVTPENLGLAHADTLDRVDALRTIKQFENEYQDLQARMAAAPGGVTRDEESVFGPMGEELGGQAAASGKVTAVAEPVTARDLMAWKIKLFDFLHSELGISGTDMPQDDLGRLDRAKQIAGRLSAPVYVADDAPGSVKDAVQQISSMGYKLVNGTDIGHTHIGANPLVVMDGAISHQRKLAEFIGMSPDLVANSDIASHRYAGTLNKIQDGVDAGRIKVPPGMDSGTLMALAQREGFIDNSSKWKSSIARLTGAGGEDAIAERAARLKSEVTGLNEEELHRLAQAQVEAEISGVMLPADINRKKFVEAFMDPTKLEEAAPAVKEQQRLRAQVKAATTLTDSDGNPVEIPGRLSEKDALLQAESAGALDRHSAEALYQAFVAGAATPPWYQLGSSKLDYLFRSSMGFAGRGVVGRTAVGAVAGAGAGVLVNPDNVAKGDFGNVITGGTAGAVLAGTGMLGFYHGGGDGLGWALANMPNKYRQIVNNTRFSLSPYFSARRVAKSNLKMALEDIPPTLRPYNAMKNAGTLAQDQETLRKFYPGLVNDVSDDADRYLQQQDIFGLYNHRHYEAYAAGHLARQGLSDQEIQDKLIRIFEYGKDGTIGRSQLERSTNFLFFPFSFDKTLYRNAGGYMLDNPAQRMVITRGLAAYDQFNKEHTGNPLSTVWMRKHLPILEEAQHLNAFAHGISPGEFGGINRPLMNMFLPQAWSSSKDNLTTLKRFVPAVNDFSRIYTELQDQGSITQRAGDNMWKDLQGLPATYADPRVSTEDKYSQYQDAFALQRNWYENWNTILEANARTTDPNNKAKFPLEPKWGRWAGEPITKGAITQMIQLKYPDYNPVHAVDYAVVNNQNLQNYLLDTKGTTLGSYAQDFVTQTKALASAMARSTMSTKDIAHYTSALRQSAIYLSGKDPRFYKMYDSSFRKTLGPLERV